MFHKPLHKLSAALAAATALAACTLAQAFTPPPFPRIGGIQIGSPFDYNDASYQQQLAQQSIMILNYYPGMDPGGESMNSAVEAIKAINPNALVFLYTESDYQTMTSSGSAYAPLINELNSMKWWLYSDAAMTQPVQSEDNSSDYTINNSTYTPADPSTGWNSIQWITHWYATNYYTPNPDIDGLFMDNVFIEPNVAGDWERDGTVLQPSSAAAQAAIQSAYTTYFNLVRTLMPGKYQIGNLGDWSSGLAIPSDYVNMVDGGVMEAMIGKSYSVESWGGWQEMMTDYTAIMGTLNYPKLAIFNQWGSTTDYQSMRYGLASCLMNDAYYSFTSDSAGYYGVVWFDEYNANLGYPIEAPPTAAWQNGVWRRDFTNGIALVNPSGNGAQTVSLGGTFVKINGTQDPSVNNGQTVTSVTLQDRDGIILLRQTPVPQPNAPTGIGTGSG